MKRNFFIRNFEGEDLSEIFFISAIATILLIRLYLHLTGYPQIGGGGLHIAHMLWGGFFMLISITLLLNFLTTPLKKLAAFLGGVGFGTFIDELGKFITKDNDYFFQPAVSIIYVIFVLIYLSFRAIRRYNFSKEEYLVNALEVLKDLVIKHITADEKERAIQYLNSVRKDNLVLNLKSLFEKTKTVPSRDFILISKIDFFIRSVYRKLIHQPLFRKILVSFFIIYAVSSLFFSFSLTEMLAQTYHNQLGISLHTNVEGNTFGELGDLIFSTLSSVLIIIGAVLIYKSRLLAYRMFKLSVLISIFLTQFFVFYDIQFGALWGFFINLFILSLLNGMIQRELVLKTSTQ